ncbi:uncharacterized, partial [Tachysurus ichikawai]
SCRRRQSLPRARSPLRMVSALICGSSLNTKPENNSSVNEHHTSVRADASFKTSQFSFVTLSKKKKNKGKKVSLRIVSDACEVTGVKRGARSEAKSRGGQRRGSFQGLAFGQ